MINVMFPCYVLTCRGVKPSSSFTSNSPQFPVPPEPDHCGMLRKVRAFPYEMPLSFNPPFALLITEVISQGTIYVLKKT